MPFLVILLFCIIGLMRVVQKVCSKKVSNQIEGSTYFHYGGYYQLVAAILSLIVFLVMTIVSLANGGGVTGFNVETLLCSIGMAAFIALGLFAEIEAMKGANLILVQMFAAGALILAALFGHFFLGLIAPGKGQPMNVYQWVGVVVFLFSTYLMISPSNPKKSKKTKKEAGQVQGEIAEDAQAVETVQPEMTEEAPVEEKPKKKRLSLKTILMLILLFIAEGGQMIMQTVFSNRVENGNVALFSFLMFAINALVLYICYLVQALARKPKTMAVIDQPIKKERRLKMLTKTLLICGAFLGLALTVINNLATILAGMVPPALLFSVSNAIAIIVTMLVGGIVYKEKVNVKNIIGIVLCAASLMVIGVFM